METQYVDLPEHIQYMLASLLSLKDPHGDDQFISFDCTGSDSKYPEKILNLKWMLAGKWQTFSYLKAFGSEIGFKRFYHLLQLFSTERDYSKRNGELAAVYDYAIHDYKAGGKARVDGRSFEEGVGNLFKKLTERDPVTITGFDTELLIPRIIIRCKEGPHSNSYDGYIYCNEEKSFKNLSFPRETPNFIKAFLDAGRALEIQKV